MIIYLTEPGETHISGIKLLEQHGHTLITDLSKHSPGHVDALFIRTYTKVTKKYISEFSNLRYILRVGVGTDNIDTEECKKRNITIINAPGSNANAVAEYVIGSMIIALRHYLAQSKNIPNNKWRNKLLIGSEIINKTIGIVGCGAIGKLIAKKLQNFEVKKIVGYDPYLTDEQMKAHAIEKMEFNELLKVSDIITLHLPLTSETKKLINAQSFDSMKSHAVLINSSRGGIIDELDLITALKKQKIAAAVLDVFENEPEIRKELLDLDNLILTPHIAGYTVEADEEMSLMPVRKFLELTQ